MAYDPIQIAEEFFESVRRVRALGAGTPESIIERAFGLAGSGSFATMAEIEKALKREGFTQVSDHLCGPSLRLQLKKLMSQPTGH